MLSLMKRTGFTLIELLVVIVIIGLIISVGSYLWGSVAAAGRDNSRKADLARLKNVLEQYSTDNRAYPTFDTTQGAGRIYAAEWQLASNQPCTHATGINKRLTPDYIDEIPADPRHAFQYSGGCGDQKSQTGSYLYLSSPGSTAPAANSSATGYALLATLEKAKDRTNDIDNPVRSLVTNFGYYSEGGVLDFPYNMDANYVVFSNNTR